MAKKEKTKELWKTCKHENTSTGSVKALNGDDLAYLVCDDCGTIVEWKRVKKEKDEKSIQKETEVIDQTSEVAEKPEEVKKEAADATVETEPAKEVGGRPSSARPKPKAEKPKSNKEVDEVIPETPTKVSNSFVLKDITVDGDNAIFIVTTDKGKKFSVIKESTAEKAQGVVDKKDMYIEKTAIVVAYTALDEDGIPTDGAFEQMVNITPK